jgi:hypothetical protein
MMHRHREASPVDTSQHKGRYGWVVMGAGFVGQLATYKCLNMDHVAGQALAIFRRIEKEATE